MSKMCNEIKCAIQYSVDLINNIINRDVQEECANNKKNVQTGCTGYVHIKLSHVNVNVMRLSLSLGA